MIWHLKVPSELKMFVWRLARQSMLTGTVLKHHHMATKDTCLFCRSVDTWKHALISCPMAASVWALAPEELVEKLIEHQQESAKYWLFALHENLDGK